MRTAHTMTAQTLKRSIRARRLPAARRGTTAVLAMMYLMLFSVLALGFYGIVTTSAQVAHNDKKMTGARVAAESGMHFMKYQLGTLGIPPRTDPLNLFDTTFARLSAKLNGTPNMGGHVVGIDHSDPAVPKIMVPAGRDAYIKADELGHLFRAEVTRYGAHGLRVKVIGKDQPGGTITADVRGARGVKLDYDLDDTPAYIFNYGIASRSVISLQGNVSVTGAPGQEDMGSILSTTANGVPVTIGGGASISGDLTYANGTPDVSSNASVAGFSPGEPGYEEHVHKTDYPPDFPMIDTSAYTAFAPPKGSTGPSVITSSSPPAGVYKNIRIKAGTNPTFNANTVLQGVVVVEYPNTVKFTSDVTVQATIVSETDNYEENGVNNTYLVEQDLADRRFDNRIEFGGNTQVLPVSDLTGPEFPQALKDLKGAMVMVPGFAASFTGSFGTVSGSIIASQLSFSGDASGTIRGTVVNLEDTVLSIGGNNKILIEAQTAAKVPDGVIFGERYTALPGSYREVRP